MVRQVRQLDQQADAIILILAHTHNAAAANLHTGLADVIQRIQTVLVGPGCDDVAVVLLGGVQVVVVIIQTGLGQLCRLLFLQHAQGHAGLQPEGFHLPDHIQNIGHVFLRRTAPGRAHTEPGGALLLCRLSLGHHLLDFQQLLFLEASVVMTALRAIFAVFRAGTGLDRQQRAHLHLVGIKVLPVRTLGTKQKIVKGKLKQLAGFLQCPVVTELCSGHVKVLLTFPGLGVYG